MVKFFVSCLVVGWLFGSLLVGCLFVSCWLLVVFWLVVGWLVVFLLVVGWLFVCWLLVVVCCCFMLVFFGIFVCFLRTKVCGAEGAVVANIAVRLTLPNLSPTNRSSEEDREIRRKTVGSGFETRNSEIWITPPVSSTEW